MNKLLSGLFCFILLGALLTPMPVQSAEFVMKISLPSPMVEWTQFNEPYAVLKSEIEKRSNGRIEVQLYPAGVLGDMVSGVEQVKTGIIQGVQVGDGWIANHFPEIQVISIPYVFQDRDVAWKVLDGPFGKEMMDAYVKKTGLRLLHLTENGGFRSFSNNVREIKSVADMKGLKIRVMPNPAHQETVKAMGALPETIDWGELYTALQTRVADGQENAVPTFLVPKLYEVQKFMTLDGHFYSINSVIIQDKWYQSLPVELRRAIDQAAYVSTTVNRGVCTALEQKGIKFIEEKGMKVYAPTAKEKLTFKTASQKPVVDFLRTQKMDKVWIDKVFKATEQAEKELGYR
jgi:tripartite ATP-independent transporter DctP family solute receptor